VNGRARMAVVTLALLCLYAIGAGAAVARMLPGRLALLEVAHVAGAPPVTAPAAFPGVTGTAGGPGPAATPAGVRARLAPLVTSGALGPHVGVLVADLVTGRVLYAVNAGAAFTPASTTKLATAVAALSVLGPSARFTTSVAAQLPAAAPGRAAGAPVIVLVGGGDPVLAAGRYPAGDYPQPATLSALAESAARALRARGVRAVRLEYDDRLFTGPVLAPGWPAFGTATNYITTGNVAPIVGLELDQGRLTPSGAPEDRDDPANFRPRSTTPGLDAARAFARLLRADGIGVRGAPRAGAPPPRAARIAAVRSPPLAEIIQQMLTESNNVIAEMLARQVALATGRPATFAGAAAAVMAADRRLGVTGISLRDGSGLSPLDRISPRALVRLVRLAAWSGPARLRPAITGLPVAGFSGTLGPGSFFGPFGPAALGTVRAKTGNLTAVATMAGIAYARDGQLLAFAFMGNDLPRSLGTGPEAALAKLATALAGCGCG